MNVAVIIASPYQFIKQSDNYLRGFCILKNGEHYHVSAIAVLLALEVYRSSIANNLSVSDVPVDIYGVVMVLPSGEGIFVHESRRRFCNQQSNKKLINKDLVSGRSRI